MSKSNIPAGDFQWDEFQDTLISYVTPKKVEFGIPDAVLTALTNAQTNWETIWAIAKVKSQRTSQQVVAKDEARETYEALLRDFIQQYIMVNPAVSNDDREAMQIKPRETDHSLLPVPGTVPLIDFDLLAGNKVKVYYRQESAEPGTSGRGRPYGVAYCEFVYKIGGTPPAGPHECGYHVNATRSPFTCQFAPEQAGQKVYAYARWVNPRGEGGGWRTVEHFIVP